LGSADRGVDERKQAASRDVFPDTKREQIGCADVGADARAGDFSVNRYTFGATDAAPGDASAVRHQIGADTDEVF